MKTSARGTGDGSRAFVFLDPGVAAFELFPIFLKLAERPVLVVGGGVVAASKIEALRAAGADITVVAPTCPSRFALTGVRIVERGFEPADLDGQWLVVAAATPEVNRAGGRGGRTAPRLRERGRRSGRTRARTSAVCSGATVSRLRFRRTAARRRWPGCCVRGSTRCCRADLDEWFRRADELKREWRSTGVPMDARRPQLMEALMKLYDDRRKRESVGTGEPS